MSILFSPNGKLDVATDPSDLPEERDGATSVVSGAMQRCKNLDLDRMGIASTRKGSSKVNTAAMEADIHRIVEQGGARYTFAGTQIYKNESSIATGLTDAEWSAIQYNSYNDTSQNVFGLNGTDRKRIGDPTVYTDTIHPAPALAPEMLNNPYAFTQAWEGDYYNGFQFTQDYLTTYTHILDWEALHLAGETVTDDPVTSRGSWHFEVEPGNVLSTFDIKYTYYYGTTESDPSPALPISSMEFENAFCFSWLPPTDSNVTHIRFYRTKAGGSVYYYCDSVAISKTYFGLLQQDSEISTAISTATQSSTDVHEWGIEPPSSAPTVVSSPYACSHDWELEYYTGFLFVQEGTNYNYWCDWEGLHLAGIDQRTDSVPQRACWVFEIDPTALNVYNFKYTYVRKSGSTVICESNPSSALSMTTKSRAAWMVSWTASTEAQVTHVRLYRTLAGGSTYYYDREVAIGTTQIAFIKQDSELSSTTLATDHDRPPAGAVTLGPDLNGNCFILDDNKVYYCKAKQPEYWPAAYYVEAGTLQLPLKAGAFWNGQLYAMNQREIFAVQGTGPNSFFPVPVSAMTGTRGLNAALSVRGYGIFHLGGDGIYLFDGQADRKFTDQYLQPIFQGTTTNGIPGINLNQLDECIMILFNGKLWFAYPGGTNAKPSDILIVDIVTMRIKYFTYGVNFTAFTVDETNSRLLAGDTSGYIWELENAPQTLDDSTAISWETESKDFTLQTRAHFPRFAKWDVDAGRATTATGSIVLDGTVHQNHTLSADRDTTKRLVDTGNGTRCSMRISGTGPVDIYASEME